MKKWLPVFMLIAVLCASSAWAAIIGDYVWNDANRNGIQDGWESGMPGIQIEYSGYFNGRDFAYQTVTDAAGYYLFPLFDNTDFTLSFFTPEGYQFTLQDAGSDDSLDSDVDLDGDITISGMIGEDFSVDAGMYAIPLPGGIWLLISGVLGLAGVRNCLIRRNQS